MNVFGGKIAVISDQGKGCIFIFSIILGKDKSFVDIMNSNSVIQAPSLFMSSNNNTFS